MSKNTGIPSTNPLPRKAIGARFTPKSESNPFTIRSAAPLTKRHCPMIAASAIKIPILRQPVPNPSTTRFIASTPTSGVRIDTTKAPNNNPRKACSRSHKIERITTAKPTKQIAIAPIPPPSPILPHRANQKFLSFPRALFPPISIHT